jgi:Protein of unknown function with PCYCGC motif
VKWTARTVVASALLTVSAALLVLPQFAASPLQPVPGMQHGTTANPDEPVPAYHPQPPTDALPPTMDPALFSEVGVSNAYAIAGRVKKVLYQQPCFCHCDRSQGHGSLLDCFLSRHGSGCEICMREAFYSYEQTRKSKTPGQIREGILHGDWQTVDLAKYATTRLPAPTSQPK